MSKYKSVGELVRADRALGKGLVKMLEDKAISERYPKPSPKRFFCVPVRRSSTLMCKVFDHKRKKMKKPKFDEDGDAYIDFGDFGRHWIEDCDFGKLRVPRLMLQSFDVDGISRFIMEQGCTRIVVLCGAGISTNAGIPDFQTLYAQP